MSALASFDETTREGGRRAKSFTERFRRNKKRFHPLVDQMRESNRAQYKGNNPQIKTCLGNALHAEGISPAEMRSLSSDKRASLGLMNAAAAADPDDLAAYQAFLGLKKVPVIDESLLDPVQSIDQMTDHFMSAMQNKGAGTHILEPSLQSSTILKMLKPIGAGAFIGAITYIGASSAKEYVKSAFGQLLKDNAFTLGINVMFVASKVVKSMDDNSYGNWQTLKAAPIELARRLVPVLTNAPITYLLGGVIMGWTGGPIGFIILKLVVDTVTGAILKAIVNKILINKDAFDDMMMEQITEDEMVKKMHAEMMSEIDAKPSVFRMPLIFRNLIENKELRTIALCAPLIVPGIFYTYPGQGWIDWGTDMLVVKSFFNPALSKLLAQVLAQHWVQSVVTRPCSAMWTLSKRVLSPQAVQKLEGFATDYMLYHHLCQIAGVVFQNIPLMILNQRVSMNTMRGGLVGLIESTYMPKNIDLVPKIDRPGTEHSELKNDYLKKPTSMFDRAIKQLNAAQRREQQGLINLGRRRLLVDTEKDFGRLTAVDKAYMSIAMGDKPVSTNPLTFTDVLKFRRENLAPGQSALELNFLKYEFTYLNDIETARSDVAKYEIIAKAIMNAELCMVSKYGIDLDRIRNMKGEWSGDVIKEFSKLYEIEIEKGGSATMNLFTAKATQSYGDLSEDDFLNLPQRAAADGMSLEQFSTYVYKGGRVGQTAGIDEFREWKQDIMRVEGGKSAYDRASDLNSWNIGMQDIEKQRDRLFKLMDKAPRNPTLPVTPAATALPNQPAGDQTKTAPVKGPEVFSQPVTDARPFIPRTTERQSILTSVKDGVIENKAITATKIGEVVVSSSMKEVIAFAASNRLDNIKDLTLMMYFGGLESIIHLFSGMSGGESKAFDVNLSGAPNVVDQLAKMKAAGNVKCLMYGGKLHLSSTMEVVNDAGEKVDPNCVMRPMIATAIEYLMTSIITLVVNVLLLFSGVGLLARGPLTAALNAGPAGMQKLIVKMITDRAKALHCSAPTTAIPPVGSPDRQRMVMCHLNYLFLHFICAIYKSPMAMLSSADDCSKTAMFADVRELGLNAQGMASSALDLTNKIAEIVNSISEVKHYYQYLNWPWLMSKITYQLAKALFLQPESMWPLIIGSQDISTARISYKEINGVIEQHGFMYLETLVREWWSIKTE